MVTAKVAEAEYARPHQGLFWCVNVLESPYWIGELLLVRVAILGGSPRHG